MTPEGLANRLNRGKSVYAYLTSLENPPREVKVRIVETWIVGQRGVTCVSRNPELRFYYPFTAVKFIEPKGKMGEVAYRF